MTEILIIMLLLHAVFGTAFVIDLYLDGFFSKESFGDSLALTVMAFIFFPYILANPDVRRTIEESNNGNN